MDSVTKERQQLIKATFYGSTSSGLVVDESSKLRTHIQENIACLIHFIVI